MKTPSFWYKEKQDLTLSDRLIIACLWPVSLAYSFVGWLRRRFFGYAYHVKMPTICVGNMHAGGVGKTPFVYALAYYFAFVKNQKTVIVTRGYGRHSTGQFYVNVNKHKPCDVGDEALLLAQKGEGLYRVLVTDSRKDAAHFVEYSMDASADIMIFDDGLQDPSVNYDLRIMMLNAKMRFGNGYMLPAGPLREPIRRFSKVAHMLAYVQEIGQVDQLDHFKDAIKQSNLPVLDVFPKITFVFSEDMQIKTMEDLRKQRFIAFAGIGYPKKFYDQLKMQMNLDIVHELSLADHQVYDDVLEDDLLRLAKKHDALLITTEKDFVKLSDHFKKQVICAKLQFVLAPDICEHIEDMMLTNYRETRQAFLPK
jgi:tetraacyldisaccharide 4'-kinase